MGSANYITPTPPTYLKFGTLLEVNEQQKEIHIACSPDLPIAITGDGVASDVKAGQILRILYGFNSWDCRCAAHIASGVAKRLTTSKTMNAEEVTELHNVLRTIAKQFKSSIKTKELLDEFLSILEVQPIHLISWCQTRMGYFCKACTASNDILQAVYDVMATANIRVKERDIFFTAKNIYTLKLVSDVEPFFSRELLRPSDKSNLLVSTVYNRASSVAEKMGDDFVTESATEFLHSLQLDENGNLNCSVKIGGKMQKLHLNRHSKPSRS